MAYQCYIHVLKAPIAPAKELQRLYSRELLSMLPARPVGGLALASADVTRPSAARLARSFPCSRTPHCPCAVSQVAIDATSNLEPPGDKLDVVFHKGAASFTVERATETWIAGLNAAARLHAKHAATAAAAAGPSAGSEPPLYEDDCVTLHRDRVVVKW